MTAHLSDIREQLDGDSPRQESGWQHCAFCSAPEVSDGARCMLCLRKISPCLFTLGPERPGTSGLFWPQFTLAAIFLATTLAACWLSVTQVSLIYALVLLVVVLPAAVRTAVLMGIGRRSGKALSTSETILAFVASVAAVLVPMIGLFWLSRIVAAIGRQHGVFWDDYQVLGCAACMGIGWAVWPAFRR